MPGYGQFCPMAKATELVGEKWTLLVLRELFLGTTRFSDFQRALSRMSPTLLSKRLRHLEQCGIVIRKKRPGQRGYEYRLSAAGRELGPLIEILATWGMRWARARLTNDELDVEFLMREMQRQLDVEKLPDKYETVIGAGTKIWHFSHVLSGARIGENCKLGQNVNIGKTSIEGSITNYRQPDQRNCHP